MTLAATTRAFNSRPRTPTAKLVLIRLADCADEDGVALIDWADLATFAMCAESHVREEIAFMERDGFLVAFEESDAVQLLGGEQ